MVENRPDPFKGYEPNITRTHPFNFICRAMECSQSAPPEGIDFEGMGSINPFYSRKIKDEMKLDYARPNSLPVTAVSPEDRQPIQSEGVIDKGRGRGRRWLHEALGGFLPHHRVERRRSGC